MLFKPYGHDNWWQIIRKMPPDKLTNQWEHSWGEFSASSAIAFDKHIQKLREHRDHEYKATNYLC